MCELIAAVQATQNTQNRSKRIEKYTTEIHLLTIIINQSNDNFNVLESDDNGHWLRVRVEYLRAHAGFTLPFRPVPCAVSSHHASPFQSLVRSLSLSLSTCLCVLLSFRNLQRTVCVVACFNSSSSIRHLSTAKSARNKPQALKKYI